MWVAVEGEDSVDVGDGPVSHPMASASQGDRTEQSAKADESSSTSASSEDSSSSSGQSSAAC